MSRISADPLEIPADGRICSPPCVFVLVGATGDLAARKIAPALYHLAKGNQLAENFVVLGVARRPRGDEQFREEMLAAIREHSRSQPIDEELWGRLSERWFYHVTHADDPAEYVTLGERLAELDKQFGTQGNRMFYLAMPPETYAPIIRNLGEAGLSRGGEGAFVRLIVEKPFGHDLASAGELNEVLLKYFDEGQVYRIDHYLGKETVQNLLVFRFANAIIDPLLTAEHVDHVEITTAETVGMEGRRGPYYESAGAMRDMMQNHMFQMLALVAMERPKRLEGEAIRDEKIHVLEALRPMTEREIRTRTVRGRYGAGTDSPAYRDEEGVAPDSQVETYAAMKLFVDTPRWRDVPFYLRTGKHLAAKTSQILVVFKREPVMLFSGPGCDFRGGNRLAIRVFPDEGISLVVDAKVPGVHMLLRPVRMDFQYRREFDSSSPEAYEHLLMDAICGDPTLFIRNDEVEASWRFIDHIRDVWARAGEPPLIEYAPGSWGPEEAEMLFEDPYMRWQPV